MNLIKNISYKENPCVRPEMLVAAYLQKGLKAINPHNIWHMTQKGVDKIPQKILDKINPRNAIRSIVKDIIVEDPEINRQCIEALASLPYIPIPDLRTATPKEIEKTVKKEEIKIEHYSEENSNTPVQKANTHIVVIITNIDYNIEKVYIFILYILL